MNIRWILTGLTMATLSACGSGDKTTPRGNGGMAGPGDSGGMAGAGGGSIMDICTSSPKAVWARAFANQSSLGARVTSWALDTAADGSFVVGGEMRGVITFGEITPYSMQINGGQGYGYALLLRLADDGSFRWGRAYSSANGARILFVRPLSDGSILIAADFQGRVSFDYGLPSQILVSRTALSMERSIFPVSAADERTFGIESATNSCQHAVSSFANSGTASHQRRHNHGRRA